MGKKKHSLDSTEVLTPIWVLKAKVEQDWEQFRLSSLTPGIATFDEDEDLEEISEFTAFPELDSTIKCLEVLEKYGIYFNTKGGYWENE